MSDACVRLARCARAISKALSGGVQATFQRSRRSGQAAVEFVCVRARACSSHPERAPHEKGPTIRRGTTDSSPPDKRDRRVGGFGEKNSHKIRPKIESNMNGVKESHSGGTARAKGSLEAAVAQKSEIITGCQVETDLFSTLTAHNENQQWLITFTFLDYNI